MFIVQGQGTRWRRGYGGGEWLGHATSTCVRAAPSAAVRRPDSGEGRRGKPVSRCVLRMSAAEDAPTLATTDPVAGSYGAAQILVLENLEAVRRRPGMYIGSTGPRGLHHLVYEVVDNSVDEALAGHCTQIVVRLHADGSVSVLDDGRGIPTDQHPKTGLSALETVLTKLHAGGKFGSGGYKVSGGLHGVGVSVVNALSVWLEAVVYRDGQQYRMRFERGDTVQPLQVSPDDGSAVPRRGTSIRFAPDPTIFTTQTRFDFDTLASRLNELAYLNAGLEIRLVDERATTPIASAKAANASAPEVDADDADDAREDGRRYHWGADAPAATTSASGTPRSDLPPQGGARGGRGDRAAVVQRPVYRYRARLCQQHPHRGRRHAPGRLQGVVDAANQLVRPPEGCPEGLPEQPRRRFRARGPHGDRLGQSARPGIRGPDQEPPRQPGVDGCAGEGAAGLPGGRGGTSRPRYRAPQIGAGDVDAARKTGRLRLQGPARERGVHRGGRLGRRQRQAGPRSPFPGDSAYPRQDHQHRKERRRQGVQEHRGASADHRAWSRLQGRRLPTDVAAVSPHHHHDRCRLGWSAHSHAAADVLLSVSASGGGGRVCVRRQGAAVQIGDRWWWWWSQTHSVPLLRRGAGAGGGGAPVATSRRPPHRSAVQRPRRDDARAAVGDHDGSGAAHTVPRERGGCRGRRPGAHHADGRPRGAAAHVYRTTRRGAVTRRVGLVNCRMR
eukprot:ctg_1258.g287